MLSMWREIRFFAGIIKGLCKVHEQATLEGVSQVPHQAFTNGVVEFTLELIPRFVRDLFSDVVSAVALGFERVMLAGHQLAYRFVHDRLR